MCKAEAYIVFVLILLSLIACGDDKDVDRLPYPELMEFPAYFDAINVPEDNPYSYERWEIGKALFFDPILSRDSSISCADCHKQELAFSDNVAISPGVDGLLGSRNAPTLANVGFQPYYLTEGGLPTLEMQVLVPIQEHAEFDFNIVLIADRLKNSSYYNDWIEDVFDRKPDSYVITRSIATFERSLISAQSPYDQFIQGDEEALSESARAGMDLFFSDALSCSECHGGPNFTTYAFENNGLYEVYDDPGRFRVTNDPSDIARFKVPTLRNIELTAPYMHNGSLQSLDEVLEHYNTGGFSHMHKSELIRPLGLSPKDLNQLKDFLFSLTDRNFKDNPLFKP